MAKLIDIEKTQYINKNIQIFSEKKIGQYSKFLNKNPLFITYYHINDRMSRADIGTGGIQSELGSSSPIRFNKIKEFPIYNFPDTIRPDITFDETGYDIDIDLSDITILPNTIKPIPGDYLLLSFPGIKEFLFRVNTVRNNSIQSNDFYQVDLDIKDVGLELEEKRLQMQIVEVYQTIFDNIGTQNKCFILEEDIEKINALVKTLEFIQDNYMNNFYNKECNSFVLDNFDLCRSILYDPYLEKFINFSNIFYKENNESALVLTPNDILQPDFDYIFSRTLWNAVLNRTTNLLSPYAYYYVSTITKKFSPFTMYGYEDCKSVKVFLSDNPLFNEEEKYYNVVIDDMINVSSLITKNDNMNLILNVPNTFTVEDGYDIYWSYLEQWKNNSLLLNDYYFTQYNEKAWATITIDIEIDENNNLKIGKNVISEIFIDGIKENNLEIKNEDKSCIIFDIQFANLMNGKKLAIIDSDGTIGEYPIEQASLNDWIPINPENRTKEILIKYTNGKHSRIKIDNNPTNNTSSENNLKYPDITCQCPLNPNYEQDLIPGTCIPVSKDGIKLYDDYILIQDILRGELTSDDYLDKIIFNYFMNIKEEINKDILLKSLLKKDYRTFIYTPIIIFIILHYYNEYFVDADYNKKKIFGSTTS